MNRRSSGMTRACSPDKSPPAAPFPATGGAGGAIRELYGGAEDFLTRDRRFTQAARVEDTPRCRVGFPILQGAEAVGISPEEFAAQLRDEVAKWRAVVRAAGIKPE